MSVVEHAVEDRLEGERPGRLRSLLAAAVAGAAAGALAYKFLRSESDSAGAQRHGGRRGGSSRPRRTTDAPARRRSAGVSRQARVGARS
jgi:hypothetical protein